MPVDPVILLIIAVVIANLAVMAVILIPPILGRSSPMARDEAPGVDAERRAAEAAVVGGMEGTTAEDGVATQTYDRVVRIVAWTFLLAGTPFGSPFAWPFAIVAVEIGLLAGVFGYAGVFRSRPDAPFWKLAAGIVVATALLGGLVWYGIVPHYRDLCATAGGGCLDLLQPIASIPPVFLVVALVFLGLALACGVLLATRLLVRRDLGVVYVLVAGATCGVISALIAAPIAAYVFAGVTGSGTDFLVLLFQQAGSDLQTAVLQQSLISDPIDKTITYLVVFALLGAASRRVTARFPQGEQALGTVRA